MAPGCRCTATAPRSGTWSTWTTWWPGCSPRGGPGSAGRWFSAAGRRVGGMVHVDDGGAGLFAAWRAGFSGPLILGGGESVSVNDMVDAARRVTGAEIPVQYVPAKPGEMPAVIVDISAARA